MADKELTETQMWSALPNTSGEEKAALLIQLSRQAHYRGAYAESLELANAGVTEYESIGVVPYEQLADAYLSLATAHRSMNNFRDAIAVADKAITVAKEDNYPFLDDILRSKAISSGEVGDWEVSLETHLEAVRFNELNGSEKWMAKSLFNVALCLFEMDRFAEAIEPLRKARAVFVAEKNVADVGRADCLLADCYVELKSGEEALSAATKSLDVAEVIHERVPAMRSHLVLARAQMLLEDFESAEKSIDQANELAISCRSDDMDWDFIIMVYEERANLLRSQNKFSEAEKVLSRIQTIKDIYEQEVA